MSETKSGPTQPVGPVRPDAPFVVPGISTDVVKALAEEGFPPKFIQAFLNTANVLNTVVLTRTPGGPALGLVERRFDLKGFYIKTKSCDWGPMAGFVCMLPWFNKSGAKSALDNMKYTVKYLADRPNVPAVAGTPYLGIRIPQSRLTELAVLSTAFMVTDRTALTAANPVGPLFGYAYNKDKSVVMDFMLRKTDAFAQTIANVTPDPLWEVLNGNVWYANSANTGYVLIDPQSDWFSDFRDKKNNLVVPTPIAAVLTGYAKIFKDKSVDLSKTPVAVIALAAQRTALATEFAKFSNVPRFVDAPMGDITRFAPVGGFVNPYPPLSVTTPATKTAPATVRYDDYRNVVSGDFDLFSIWPAVGNLLAFKGTPMAGLVRWSEQPQGTLPKPTFRDDPKNPHPNLSVQSGKLFAPVPGKQFARSLVANPNVIVEFVPDDPVESPEYGNINNDVLLTAQRLNGQAYYYYNVVDGFKQPPSNVAFHSDEGGRPFTKDIGYNVAMFVPDHLVEANIPAAQVITTNSQFLKAIMSCKGSCLVPIQAAWLAVLMMDAVAPDIDDLEPSLLSLILGQLPPNTEYSDEQVNAYTELLDLFNLVMKFDVVKKEFTNTLGTSDFITNHLLPAIDYLEVGGPSLAELERLVNELPPPSSSLTAQQQ